jgi:YD repeat-containing protein
MKTIAQQLNIKDFPFSIKDKQGNELYFEDSDGFWHKLEYDSSGNIIYYEDSDGIITDNRPKDDIITLNGIKYKRIDE